MYLRLFFGLLFLSLPVLGQKPADTPYVFFLHNRFLEEHELNEEHPQFGRTEYVEILTALRKGGLTLISEQRKGNVNARDYAHLIVQQIDSLLALGVTPNKITVVGTSKGGYIAQFVSSIAQQPNVNYVFVACYQDSDLQNLPDVNYCGNILTIYEKSDPYGVSALARKNKARCPLKQFKEIELDTGMGHGFLFKPLDVWIKPTIQWAHANYAGVRTN